MKLSKIQQIIKEEVAKAVSEVNDEYGTAMSNLEKAVGLEPTAGGPENKMSEEFILYIPSLENGDADTILRSKDKINRWIEQFRAKYNEEPKLKKIEDKYINDTHYMKVDVLNQAFNDWRKEYISGKSRELEKYKNID